MAEQRPLGCGLFSEEEWAELVAGSGPDAQADAAGRRELLEHVRTCAACRAELAALARLSQQVRHVLAEADATLHDAVREAFVAGVMAQVRQPAQAARPATHGPPGTARQPATAPPSAHRTQAKAQPARGRRPGPADAAAEPGAAAPAGRVAAAARFWWQLAGGLPWTTLLMPNTCARRPGMARRHHLAVKHGHGPRRRAVAGVVQAGRAGRNSHHVLGAGGGPASRASAPAPFSAEAGAVSLFSAPETTHGRRRAAPAAPGGLSAPCRGAAEPPPGPAWRVQNPGNSPK